METKLKVSVTRDGKKNMVETKAREHHGTDSILKGSGKQKSMNG